MRHVRHAGRRVRRRRPLRHRPAGRAGGPGRGAGARRRARQQRAGVRVRDPRADLLARRPEARALFMPEGRVPREGDVLRDPRARPTRSSGSAPRGRRRSTSGDIGARDLRPRVPSWAGRSTREDLAAYEALPREPVRVRYRGREVLTNPPPSAGGTLLAYALALLQRSSGPPDAMALVRGDGARPGRAHARVPHRARRARLPRSLHGQPARRHHPHLGDRRRRLGVLGHVHQRRGVGRGRARDRRARQQHDGRAGPVAAGLLHAPAGPAAAVDDGADRRARRATARRSWRSARPARTGSARRCCR